MTLLGKKNTRCHVGVQKVMTIGKMDIYAGGLWDVGYDFNWNLMLRLTEDFHDLPVPSTVRVSHAAKAFVPKTVSKTWLPPTIDVVWADFDVPDLDRKWWVALHETIGKMPQGKMVVHCQGGHGRTGTALAILLGLSSDQPKDLNPVEMIRKWYCHSAVESDAQIAYIKWITGLKFEAKGTWQTQWSWDTVYDDKANAASTTTTQADVIIEPDDPVRIVGEDIYAELPDGSLAYVGPDDGSFYGKNHEVRTGGK